MDPFKNQLELQRKVWRDQTKLTKLEDKIQETRLMCLALQGEISELVECTECLPWKKEKCDIDHIQEEIVDIFHFFINICLTWGITSLDELIDKYKQKADHNINRGRVHEKKTKNWKFKNDNS